jgi:uncharacterized protein (TIGR00299 family) protein
VNEGRPGALRGLHLHFDCFSGISGDMALGAFLDLGVPEEVIRSELAKLPVSGYRIERTRVHRGALVGTKITVAIDEREDRHHENAHEHRHYRTIREMLEGALTGEVLRRSLEMFHRLAEVEARVHGVSVEEVAFHEVGAVDSIVDIVGTAAALSWLSPAMISCRKVPLGGGVVATAHGRIPVPAPATLELLRGCPVESGGDFELTTPTGAAIVRANVDRFGEPPPWTVAAVGWGAGERNPQDRPNLLRVLAGEPIGAVGTSDALYELAANIDDMNPELCAPVLEMLLEMGALDAWWTPIIMKKGRPALTCSALVPAELRAAVIEALLRDTTTLGVRFRVVERQTLSRRLVDVETPYGPLPIKVASPPGRPDEIWNAAPEFEACRRVAEERGVAPKLVYAAALGAFFQKS